MQYFFCCLKGLYLMNPSPAPTPKEKKSHILIILCISSIIMISYKVYEYFHQTISDELHKDRLYCSERFHFRKYMILISCTCNWPLKYYSPIYRISLANALPNVILSKFALVARNSGAFGSICKHSEKISSCCEN